jgi:KaiC/GvpD/RAD55 family RecA-like ATPase
MKRSLSAAQALAVRNKTLSVSPDWRGCLGDEIARHGIVFIWGNSGNCKSSAVMAFAKMLSSAGKVLYVSKEEGYSLSFQNTLRRFGMQECGTRFQVVDSDNLDMLIERLEKPKSPEFVIIDSVQAIGMGTKQYKALRERFRSKLLVLVSQADGKRPAGRPAVAMMYDADLKLWVEGHTVFSKGRFMGETKEYVTWEEGAQQYWDGRKKEF